MNIDTDHKLLSPAKTGMLGRCPRCGEGHLFSGFLTIRDKCESCDLDYSFADPADGPAFFMMMFGCVPTVVVALFLQSYYPGQLWMHLVFTVPLMLLTCILPLRPVKGWLIASQYNNKALEAIHQNDLIIEE